MEIEKCNHKWEIKKGSWNEKQICTKCGKQKIFNNFEGPSIASADFPGDKSYVIDKGGPKIYPCKRCDGTGKSQPVEPVDEIKIDKSAMCGPLDHTYCPKCGVRISRK